MATDVGVCSKALLLCGSAPISSLSGTTLEQQLVNNLYAVTRDSIFAAWEWHWCRVSVDLTATASGTPVADWDYHYNLPADYARAIGLGNDGDSDGLPFVVEGGKILTDEAPTVTLTYIAKKAESTWPTWFEMYVALELASVICIPLVESASRAATLAQAAEQKKREARRMDNEEADQIDGPPDLPEVLTARM